MLCSSRRCCFQGRRLLVIDLQPCYKSRAKGSLLRWLSTAASIPHGSASPFAGEGALITPYLCRAVLGSGAGFWLCHAPRAAGGRIYRRFIPGLANPWCGLQPQGRGA